MRQLRHTEEDPVIQEINANFRKSGTCCPICHAHLNKIVTVKAAQDGIKIRYHKCLICKERFKSIEIE